MKEELRYKYKIKRKYFQHSRREVADGAIADCFLQAFGDKESFFIYLDIGSEAATRLIIDKLIEAGKRVYAPRVVGDKMVAAPLTGELKKGAFGVEEPTSPAYDGKIDVTVMPLLAINSRGYRLGYGKGYYDKFVKDNKHMTEGGVKVGLGYFFQLTDEFEEDPWDEPADLFVCERGIYSFGRNE